MNIKQACNYLCIQEKDLYTLSDRELKQLYRKLALQYHPDKCKLDDATEKFQLVNEAYEYICIHRKIEPEKTDYRSLLLRYLGYYFKEPVIVLDLLLSGLNTTFGLFINKMDQSKLLQIYIFLQDHRTIFHIPDEILHKIHSRLNKHDMIVLECSLKDLMHKNVYILNEGNEKVYVPLWHEEIVYTINDKELVVCCHCNTPDNVIIDKDNNIHITVHKELTKKMLEQKEWEYCLDGVGKWKIPYTIEPKQYQEFMLKEQGIPKINLSDIFDESTLSNIIIHLYLSLS